MEIKAIFGILSAFFTFSGLIPYFLSISKGQVYPHNLSWLGWAFITFVGGVAMLSDGFTWSVAILFANTIVCIIVVVFSIYKKVGIWSTTIYDYLFFSLGVLGVILWQIFDAPLVAVVFAVIADLSFGVPTIIKVYKNPKSEIPIAWLSSSIAGLLSLFAVRSLVAIDFLYPLYLFMYDTLVLILILFKINNKSKN